MTDRRPTVLFLDAPSGIYRRLLSLQQYQPNELVLEIAGLKGIRPILRGEWPIRETFVSDGAQTHYEYRDLQTVDRQLEHFTVHGDGWFHVRVAGSKPKYVHKMQGSKMLGPGIGVFLDFFVLTCRADDYAWVGTKPEPQDATIEMSCDSAAMLRCLFAGKGYDLVKHVADTVPLPPVVSAIHLPAVNIQGLVIPVHVETLVPPRHEGVPKGTIVVFRFPVFPDRVHYKAFLIS